MNQEIVLQRVLGRIFSENADYTDRLEDFKYTRINKANLRFLYIASKAIKRIIDNKESKRGEPMLLDKNAILWFCRKRTRLNEDQVKKVMLEIEICINTWKSCSGFSKKESTEL